MTLTNREIARSFEDVASLMELLEESWFKVRAYRNAADTIRSLDSELGARVEAGEDLTQLRDIGAAIAQKIEELVTTGELDYLERLKERSAPGLLEILRLPGLGPKRVRILWQELEITSLAELRAAAEGGRLREASGFGAKSEEDILRRLDRHEQRKSE